MAKNVKRMRTKTYSDTDLEHDLIAIKQANIEYRYLRVEIESIMNNIEILYMRVIAHLEQKSEDDSEDKQTDNS